MPPRRMITTSRFSPGVAAKVTGVSNGDAAAEQLINAVEKADQTHPGGDRRTVMIHAQTVRDDQLACSSAARSIRFTQGRSA